MMKVCAVIGQLNVTHVSYSTVIRYDVPSPSDVISRTTVYYVPAECVLSRLVDPTNRVDPTLRTAAPSTGQGRLNVSLILFHDHRFQVSLTGFSVVYTVRQKELRHSLHNIQCTIPMQLFNI